MKQTESISRIIIVDDHPLLVDGLMALFAHHKDIKVVGKARSLVEARELMKKESPDLVLLDIALQDGSGLDLLKEWQTIEKPPVVLILSMFDENVYAERSLRLGAKGYVMKDIPSDKLVEQIRKAARGEIVVSERLTHHILTQMAANKNRDAVAIGFAEKVARLSDRELEIFELIGQGKTTKQIAVILDISSGTVDTHRYRIKDKLAVEKMPELICRAVHWVGERNFHPSVAEMISRM